MEPLVQDCCSGGSIESARNCAWNSRGNRTDISMDFCYVSDLAARTAAAGPMIARCRAEAARQLSNTLTALHWMEMTSSETMAVCDHLNSCRRQRGKIYVICKRRCSLQRCRCGRPCRQLC